MEPFYPLHALVCAQCFLVQLEEYESPEHIFTDYAYFSSYSSSLARALRALRRRDDRALRPRRATSQVVEIASNDGYLLQYFVERGIPVLGIEPAANVAEVAVAEGRADARGVLRRRDRARARAPSRSADLLLGNNVLAHVPDLNDFVGGMKVLLKPGGVITMEFPHLMRLIDENQWDTIYHEHFSYFSFTTVAARVRGPRPAAVRRRGAADARRLAAHLRLPRRRRRQAADRARARSCSTREDAAGYSTLETYLGLRRSASTSDKREILEYADRAQARRASGSSATARRPRATRCSTTAASARDFLDYTVDLNPHKQGHLLPGHAHPDPRARGDRARTGRTSC